MIKRPFKENNFQNVLCEIKGEIYFIRVAIYQDLKGYQAYCCEKKELYHTLNAQA